MKPVIVDENGMVKKMEWGKPICEDCDVQFGMKIKGKKRIISYLKSFEDKGTVLLSWHRITRVKSIQFNTLVCRFMIFT